MKKSEEKPWDLWDNIKKTIHAYENPRKEREMDRKLISRKNVLKIPKHGKINEHQIHGTQTPNKLNLKGIYTETHIIKLSEVKHKEKKIESSSRKVALT